MAFEGTHLRFANDVKDLLKVKDLSAYISGSIYPDSRYYSGIDRNLTHGDFIYEQTFIDENDFRKGWFSHVICDQIQYDLMLRNFDDLLKNLESKATHGNQNWIVRTAIKVLQDLEDIKNFEIRKLLNCLDYVEAPNGESLDRVRDYNKYFFAFYSLERIEFSNVRDALISMGINGELANEVIETAKKLQADADVYDRIKLLYSETLNAFSSYIKQQ